MKNTIEKSVDETLRLQIDLITNSIETSLEASLKNYFRASSDLAVGLAQSYYNNTVYSAMTEDEAKKHFLEDVSNLEIGVSGYYSVVDSQMEIIYHPVKELIGQDGSRYSFVDEIIGDEENFFGYDWKRPSDTVERKKAMYSVYFEAWDWYILSTGYEEEFKNLVHIEDLEESILSINFGETGYPIVVDFSGTFIVHPEYKGVNMMDRMDSMGDVTRKAITEKNGKTEYMWKNPGDSDFRKKVTVYSEIEGYDMIVAATAYESEFLGPLRSLTTSLILTFITSIIIVMGLTIKVSDNITKPIIKVKTLMDEAESGDLSVRCELESEDEVGEISLHFNKFLGSLETKQLMLIDQLERNSEISNELRASLEDLKTAQARLIEEERFSNMGKLVTRVSHHLNTPVGNAMMALSYFKHNIEGISQVTRTGTNEYLKIKDNVLALEESAVILKNALDATAQIVNSFNKLNTELHTGRKLSVDFKELLELTIYPNWISKLPENIELEIECDEVYYETYPSVLELVFDNLIENSVNHGLVGNSDGRINIKVSEVRGKVEIVYQDNGIGIPTNRGEYIFEPFFSAHDDLNALGLGLNIIYNAISGSLKGSIVYEKNEPSGVKFIIRI